MIDLCLTNCKILPENLECSIGIDDGKIISIKKIPPKSSETIDIKGNPILPGLIDPHVHFRDPGLTYKEDFRTGSEAAAAGGFTTVMDMPNTKPPTVTKKAFLEKLGIAQKKSIVDFALHASVYDIEQIKPLSELKTASFKIYMDSVDNGFLMEVFEEISKLNEEKLILLHAEEKDITNYCTDDAKMEGSISPEIYAEARPPLAETIATSIAISMALYFNLSIHICHVSAKQTLELIENAKKIGCKITSEITPHHLFLDSHYLKKMGNFAKTNPPLRDKIHRLKISDLNKIEMIGTDHAPHTVKEKKYDLWEAPPGIPNLETTLPLLLTQINENKMSFRDIKRVLCENPAIIFDLPHKGKIAKGMDADFVIVDMKKESIINPENFKTKAKYSPFEGFNVKGMPIMTMVRGNMVMENGEVFENKGKHVYE